MSELKFNGRTTTGVTVEKFPLSKPMADGRPWSEAAAHKYIDASYRPDNLMLTDGKDCYVVSKQGLGIGHKHDGKTVEVDGKQMKIWRAHDNPDTKWDKVKLWFRMVPLMIESTISQAMGRGNGFS